jgi:hypothetical protein
MSKLLVVDKSILHGLSDEKACAFGKGYNVVFPHALAAECLMSDNKKPGKNPGMLFTRFDGAIKAGAKMGYSLSKLFQAEKMALCPAKSVVDESSTQQFRDGTPNTSAAFIKQEAECCRKSFEPKIKLLSNLAETFYENLCKKGLSKDFCKEAETHIDDRPKTWIQAVDQKIKDILKDQFSEEISCRADANWFTWQWSRLAFVWAIGWACKRNHSGSSYKGDIPNDFYDIEYVAYLSRADGLLSNDQNLVVPLAKAAFPQKGVFNDINDVPQSYRIK